MKLEERTFCIYSNERPKVLLVGSGICQAFGGQSWNTLLDEIKNKNDYTETSSNYIMPMPYKAAMLTNNTLAKSMRSLTKKKESENEGMNWQSFTKTTEEMRSFIRQLIEIGFDYVLTTNYSYEIEAALLDAESLSKWQISRMMNYYEVDNAQTKFLMNTFNLADTIPVWHIHGEARKPDSMIIGSYYYGKLLRRCVERLDGSLNQQKGDEKMPASRGKAYEFERNIKNTKSQKIGSWVDAVILGNVYVVGLGLGFSETELWWLLEYKQNHRGMSGETIFYSPQKPIKGKCAVNSKYECKSDLSFVPEEECRNLLLEKVFEVKTRHLGYTIYDDKKDYPVFYKKVLADLRKEL